MDGAKLAELIEGALVSVMGQPGAELIKDVTAHDRFVDIELTDGRGYRAEIERTD